MSVIQPYRSTASACIRGMITKPPPYERAPTLNATQLRDASVPPVAAATIERRKRRDRETATREPSPADLDCTAQEQHRDEPWTEGCRGGGAEQRVGDESPAHIRSDPVPGRPEQQEPRMNGDRRDGCSGSRTGAADPVGRGAQEERRQRDDQDEAGKDEAEPADQRTGEAARPPGRVDRELRRGRPGEEVGGGEPVLELLRRHPPAALDDELPKQCDVRRWPTEPDDPDPSPRARDRSERGHVRR